jgi:hypothetical protein
MKHLALGILLVLCSGASLFASSSLDYLKISNYRDHLTKAEQILEKLFMDDLLTLTGEGRQMFVFAWKSVREKKGALPASGSSTYVVLTSAQTALGKAATDLDTLVYDQMVTFKTPAAKAAYRDALKSIRIALSCL